MKDLRRLRLRMAGLTLWLLVAAFVEEGAAQSSSLYGAPDPRRALSLSNISWTYQPAPEPREIKLHDLVTILVDEKAQVISEGEVDRKKQAYGKLTLKDWIVLKGLTQVVPAPMRNGEPTMNGAVDNKFRADSSLETREAMKFHVTAEVVDIRPNGTLVIEGHRSIQSNQEVWDMSISGVIRPEDVLPNNTVLSEKVGQMRIHKRERGHVVDGYQRGWLLQWLDHYQPF